MEQRQCIQAAKSEGLPIDRLVRGAYMRIPETLRLAAITAFFTGVLTHAYILFNKLPNHDDLTGTFSRNEMTSLGRWFLSFASAISTRASVPWVNGMIALLALALTAGLVVWMLRISSRVFAALTGMLLVTFPTVSNTLAYMFIADGFMIGLLLAVTAAALTDRYMFGFLPGAALMALSLGTYQAYIVFAVSLLYIRLLCMATEADFTIGKFLIYLLRCAGLLILGLLGYFLGLKTMLAYRDVVLSSYQGISTAGELTLPIVLSRMAEAYLAYWQFLHKHSAYFGTLFGRILFFAANGSAALLSVLLALREKRGGWARLPVLALLLLAMPLAFNCVYLMGAANVHAVMQFSLCLVYVMALVLVERACAAQGAPARRVSVRTAVSGIVALLALTVSIQGAVYSNNAYLCLQLNFNGTYALANRMLERIEHTPGYRAGETPVYVSGTLKNGNYDVYLDDEIGWLGGTICFDYGQPHRMLLSDAYFHHFALYYLGTDLEAAQADELELVYASKELAAMPCYPAEGSVRDIGGVLVVKAGS